MVTWFRAKAPRSRRSGVLLWLLPIVGLALGGYIILNSIAPAITVFNPSAEVIDGQLKTQTVPVGEDRLYIPRINVDVAIVEGDNISVLERGVWHRRPENGNPEKGGNFVLSAHRFTMGWTPEQTRKKSPFYYIDRIEPGDVIYVDFNHTRYTYEVVRRYAVARTALEIEEKTDNPTLTIYSCDLRGERAGREVIEARLAV